MSDVLTKPELERRLRVSNVTATQLLKKNSFPNAYRLRRNWRIPIADVLAFEGKDRRKTSPDPAEDADVRKPLSKSA